MLDLNEPNAKFSGLHFTGLTKVNPWSNKQDLVDTLVPSSPPLQNYLPHHGLSSAWHLGDQEIRKLVRWLLCKACGPGMDFILLNDWRNTKEGYFRTHGYYMKFKFVCP